MKSLASLTDKCNLSSTKKFATDFFQLCFPSIFKTFKILKVYIEGLPKYNLHVTGMA